MTAAASWSKPTMTSCGLAPDTQRRASVVTRRRHVPSQCRYLVANCRWKTSLGERALSAALLSAVISKKKQRLELWSSAGTRNAELRPAPTTVVDTLAPPFCSDAPQPSMPCTRARPSVPPCTHGQCGQRLGECGVLRWVRAVQSASACKARGSARAVRGCAPAA